MTYSIYVSPLDGDETIQKINEDGSVSFIPKDPANSDYQRYLNPEAEQSTPSLTDETSTK
jgi:hypothetical protein